MNTAELLEEPKFAPKTKHQNTKSGFSRFFTREGISPYEEIEWEQRSCAIRNDQGEILFEQKNVKVPVFWSQMAANVVVSRYFRGELGSKERECGIDDLIMRVVSTITKWGREASYFNSEGEAKIFEDELSYILLHQYASFNSPVWFNVGVHKNPQCSACFILAVEDSMDALLKLQETEGKLFKFGSGCGTNLSTIRSSKEKLSGGGIPSGPVSFMRAFDAWANIIKSGGKTRRAAKMQILNVTHPDILEFIRCKSSEEKKAHSLIEAGYDGGFSIAGGAYDSVSFQNANLSVRVTNAFMKAASEHKKYSTINVKNNEVCESLDAREVLKEISEGTHLCGDPGIQFDDTINEWHTCPNSGRINASNPCSEYMHLDNSACNLSSLNLLKFLRDDSSFDVTAFVAASKMMIIAQDMLIDPSSYPTEAIGKCAREYRQLGLGFANLGALLMSLGLPYDSDESRNIAAAITSLMSSSAYVASAELAKNKGTFAGYSANRVPMLKVIAKHRDACNKLEKISGQPDLVSAAIREWDKALELGNKNGFRNSQVTVLAPTGTISFMMDCDTTGIEPDIALVKYKKLVGGGFLKMVNQSVNAALKKLNYSVDEIGRIINFIDEHDTIEGAPDLKAEHLAIFDCAFKPREGLRYISAQGHLKMMAATQPFLSGAISKTVNLPEGTSVDEIFDTYVSAWRDGLKAVALYRDGSKKTQPLSTMKTDEKAVDSKLPVRKRLLDERRAITHKFSVGGLEGYITVGLYEDGNPGEIFIVVAKEGSTLSGVMDAFATSVSLALQYGVPLEALVKKFTFARFEPAGFTGNKEIPMALSIVDYIFRWLALKFLASEKIEALGMKVISSVSNGKAKAATNQSSSNPALDAAFQNSLDAPPCTGCGSHLMVRQAGCYVCLNCGAQGGCG